eukprot:1142471-Pelagomonas_calceolata.AAC.5
MYLAISSSVKSNCPPKHTHPLAGYCIIPTSCYPTSAFGHAYPNPNCSLSQLSAKSCCFAWVSPQKPLDSCGGPSAGSRHTLPLLHHLGIPLLSFSGAEDAQCPGPPYSCGDCLYAA